MADLTDEERAEYVKITGGDEVHTADVELISSKKRLLTQAEVTVIQSQGQDKFPDTYFTIDTAGGIGDTVRVQIAAVSDPTSSERDLPAVDVTSTLTVTESADELALRDLIISDLNSDSNFQNAFLKAQAGHVGTYNAIVHITSTEAGAYHHRPNVGDVVVTPTGTTTLTLAFDTMLGRIKTLSLSRDPDAPHLLGILGIAGTVLTQPGSIANRFEIEAKNGGSGDMTVDGSVTPVTFTFPAIADFDQFITSIIIQGLDNGIKLANFLAINSALSNGLSWNNKSDDEAFSFPSIHSTRQIKRFATPGGWYLDIESGNDDAMAIKEFGTNAIPVRAVGTFTTDDFMTITVNDDLSAVTDLRVIFIGFKKGI